MLELDRLEQLKRCIPDIFSYKTLLYIGVNARRYEMVLSFLGAGYVIHYLEIWPKNIWGLNEIFKNVYQGDVRHIEAAGVDKKYDVVMWWHGPEHIEQKDLNPTLEKLKKIATKLVVLACPYGIYRQGPVDGNMYEAHLSAYYRRSFDPLDWEMDVIGTANKPGSNLLVWHRDRRH